MSTSVVVTGSGNPAAHARRAGPGVLIRHNGLALQIDAGRATLMRLTAAGCAITDLDAAFLTHHHSDHVVGLADMLMTRWIHDGQRGSLFPVVGPAGPLDEMVRDVLGPYRHDLADRVRHRGGEEPAVDWRPFDASQTPQVVWADHGVEVQSVLVDHAPVSPAVGYRVSTPDGVVAVSGDTRVCEGVGLLAAGAQVLVHEAVLGALVMDSLVASYHSDARLVGEQAQQLGVQVLVLTHLIPAPDAPELVNAYADAVREGGFSGELHVADDLLEVLLP